MKTKHKNEQNTAPRGEGAALRTARRTFLRLGLALFVMVALQYALEYGLSHLSARYFPEFAATEVYYWLSHCVIMYLISMPAAWLILRPAPKAQRGENGSAKLGGYGLFAAVLISIGLMQLGNYVGNFVNSTISIICGRASYSGLDSTLMDSNPLVVLLVVVVIGPIAEELIFRRLLIDRLAVFGAPTAAVMSALTFALVHGNLQQYFYAFALGMFLSFIYLRTRNIKNSILLHMIINFVGGFVPSMLLRLIGGTDGLATLMQKIAASGTEEGMTEYMAYAGGLYGPLMAVLAWSLTLMALGAVGLGLLIASRRRLNFADCPPAEVKIPPARRGEVMFLNVGMLLFVAAMAAVLAVSFFAA